MNKFFPLCVAVLLAFIARHAGATQADDTTIIITGQTAGPTSFISQLALTASDTSVIKSIQFTIAPKLGSVTRPLSGSYALKYLISKGYLVPPSNQIFLPIYGLYSGFTNDVTLTYLFQDGSTTVAKTTITTPAFVGSCGYEAPTVLQPRTADTSLSYDYIMLRNACDSYSPAVIDTDGALRWVGDAGISDISSIFFDNSFFIANGTILYRIDLDGTVTQLHDYSDIGVTFIHHTIERGKTGLIIEVDTASDFESTDMEVDTAGNVLKTWSLGSIISAAMVNGGDDPSLFVQPPADWFHNNAVTYNRADDSLVVSSRENFVICLDYESSAIKWILGDSTKHWADFRSLTQYALALGPATLAPIGQHAVSFTYDQRLLLFDNGLGSTFQLPAGASRTYSSPRKYELNLATRVATEVWEYEMGQSVYTPLCSSIYEDAPLNYVVDYAFVNGFTGNPQYAQVLGLNAAGQKVFYYQYGPVDRCVVAFGSLPLHLESTRFPSVGPQALNLSTRGLVGPGDAALIGGFIITGADPKNVALRAIGPSLSKSGLSGTLPDPSLTLYDASGRVLTANDNWQSDPGAAELMADGLAPTDASEAATIQVLSPGSYTVVATGQGSSSGIGLVEVYDFSSGSDSKLANLSTRGAVGTGDDVLISGLIVGDVASTTTVIRALGPSLASQGVSNPLSDPTLTIYDANGAAIANNDNWQDDVNAPDISKNGLAPGDPAEAATVLYFPAGSYTAIVSGATGGTGIALVEAYGL